MVFLQNSISFPNDIIKCQFFSATFSCCQDFFIPCFVLKVIFRCFIFPFFVCLIYLVQWLVILVRIMELESFLWIWVWNIYRCRISFVRFICLVIGFCFIFHKMKFRWQKRATYLSLWFVRKRFEFWKLRRPMLMSMFGMFGCLCRWTSQSFCFLMCILPSDNWMLFLFCSWKHILFEYFIKNLNRLLSLIQHSTCLCQP